MKEINFIVRIQFFTKHDNVSFRCLHLRKPRDGHIQMTCGTAIFQWILNLFAIQIVAQDFRQRDRVSTEEQLVVRASSEVVKHLKRDAALFRKQLVLRQCTCVIPRRLGTVWHHRSGAHGIAHPVIGDWNLCGGNHTTRMLNFNA